MTRLITADRDIELQDGDTLLIQSPVRLTRDQMRAIHDTVKAGLGVHTLIMDSGLRLATVVEDPGTPIYDALLAQPMSWPA